MTTADQRRAESGGNCKARADIGEQGVHKAGDVLAARYGADRSGDEVIKKQR